METIGREGLRFLVSSSGVKLQASALSGRGVLGFGISQQVSFHAETTEESLKVQPASPRSLGS